MTTSWLTVRPAIATLFEGATPSTKKQGLPKKFKHLEEWVPGAPLPPRCFAILIKSLWQEGATMAALQRRFRADLEVPMGYAAENVDITEVMEAIALDHQVLSARVPDGSLWGRPASGIESLFLGGKHIMTVNVVVDPGVNITATYGLSIEWKAT